MDFIALGALQDPPRPVDRRVVSGPSLPQSLVESLRAHLRGPRESTLELAVQAAAAPDPAQRAWRLVALAARLRREHDLALARIAVNAAISLDAGPEPTRAAYTCAVALHADEGDLATAVRIGEGLLADGHDAYLLKTMARVYWSLWRQTKEEDWHDRWWQVHVRLHEPTPS
jgi:hypothetical protein